MSFIDMAGQKHGRLSVLHRTPDRSSPVAFVCRCDCGVECVALGYDLRRGHTRSCGCWAKELQSEANATHRRGGTPEHDIWCNMHQRCSNPNRPDYERYGGRGITVCDRWFKFEDFFADMGPRPSAKHSLEREDNSLGYSEENCVWATRSQQGRNKRSNVMVEYAGKSMTLVEAVERANLPYHTVYSRIFRGGWSPVEALSEPSR